MRLGIIGYNNTIECQNKAANLSSTDLPLREAQANNYTLPGSWFHAVQVNCDWIIRILWVLTEEKLNEILTGEQ